VVLVSRRNALKEGRVLPARRRGMDAPLDLHLPLRLLDQPAFSSGAYTRSSSGAKQRAQSRKLHLQQAAPPASHRGYRDFEHQPAPYMDSVPAECHTPYAKEQRGWPSLRPRALATGRRCGRRGLLSHSGKTNPQGGASTVVLVSRRNAFKEGWALPARCRGMDAQSTLVARFPSLVA